MPEVYQGGQPILRGACSSESNGVLTPETAVAVLVHAVSFPSSRASTQMALTFYGCLRNLRLKPREAVPAMRN